EAAPIQLGVTRPERQPASEFSFYVGRETVASLCAGTLVLLKMERIGKKNSGRSEGDRLSDRFDATIGCVVARYPQPSSGMFGNEDLTIVRSSQVIEPAKNVRPGQVAHVSIRDANLVEEGRLRSSDKHPTTNQIAIIAVRCDFAGFTSGE